MSSMYCTVLIFSTSSEDVMFILRLLDEATVLTPCELISLCFGFHAVVLTRSDGRLAETHSSFDHS